MKESIHKHIAEIKAFRAEKEAEIEQFRIKYLGRKGVLNDLFTQFKQVPNEQKKEFGQLLNSFKQEANSKLEELLCNTASASNEESNEDFTKTGISQDIGVRHPISITKNKIINIFNKLGFALSEGPEIEDDWHNFTALNLPDHHPARDMQDTFFIESNPDILLRTHTSSVQIRHMEKNTPPMRIISPGRVFRNEEISARSHCIFHQIEGLYIDKGVSFADLKQTIQFFTKELFGKSEIRLRPSYFPFTEPSAEVDVYWGLETEVDKRITKGTGWLEIMGCGMIDPNVLKNVDIDPNEYSGFAFGMGIERIAMLLYQISDIRLYYENDLRFLNQYKKAII